jgi:hypothetical protein
MLRATSHITKIMAGEQQKRNIVIIGTFSIYIVFAILLG